MSMIKVRDETMGCVMTARELYELFPQQIEAEVGAITEQLKESGHNAGCMILSLGGMLMTDPELVICEESGDMLNLKARVKELEDEVKELKRSMK